MGAKDSRAAVLAATAAAEVTLMLTPLQLMTFRALLSQAKPDAFSQGEREGAEALLKHFQEAEAREEQLLHDWERDAKIVMLQTLSKGTVKVVLKASDYYAVMDMIARLHEKATLSASGIESKGAGAAGTTELRAGRADAGDRVETKSGAGVGVRASSTASHAAGSTMSAPASEASAKADSVSSQGAEPFRRQNGTISPLSTAVYDRFKSFQAGGSRRNQLSLLYDHVFFALAENGMYTSFSAFLTQHGVDADDHHAIGLALAQLYANGEIMVALAPKHQQAATLQATGARSGESPAEAPPSSDPSATTTITFS